LSALTDKKILLGISGGIAAYKVADWVRSLRREGATVTVVMTEAARNFVTPTTFAALSGNRVYQGMFDEQDVENIPHITLAREADLVLIAPATAQTISRLAHGAADELLSTIVLATSVKILLCPAMNSRMLEHPATRKNIGLLKEYGYRIIEPACGSMACGEEGPGRLPEWHTVRDAVLEAFLPQDLSGQTILVTAGPTREPFDPVRFISNRSSGRMGYALASTARQRGGEVTLISGPTNIQPPPGVNFIRVTAAAEMYEEVMKRSREMSVIVKAAAVSDYRPADISEHKIKKGEQSLEISLERNPDILQELGLRREREKKPNILVGFAAESRDHLDEGRRKLTAKKLDLIAVNDIKAEGAGFEVETNRITLIDKDGTAEELPLLSKEETAHRIWDTVVRLLKV
jgi:phosphopantothenoylcysteine decarboxylase/phosphopantothenate--cysteine ligase